MLSHGITKEGAVPDWAKPPLWQHAETKGYLDVEIERAIERKKRFEADPEGHTYKPGT